MIQSSQLKARNWAKTTNIVTILSCNNQTKSTNVSADTNTIVFPTGSNIPADTDDHNKGNSATIALDFAGPTIQP